MRRKYDICLSLQLLLISLLLAGASLRAAGMKTAAAIAPEILRFHVLANSDSVEDQALKLEVKDLLLEEIRVQTAKSGGDASKQALCRYLSEHAANLEQTAEQYMESRGFSYAASIRLEQCEFPEKTYGDMTFPAGTYDAVRVLIGEGKGRNFWCVLYPSLCYIDSTHAAVPDESKELLKTLLPEDDFQALLRARRPSLPALSPGTKKEQGRPLPQIHVRSKLAELFAPEKQSHN